MIDEPPDVELSPQRTALSVTSAIIAWRTCAAIPKPDDGWPICPFGRIVRRADGAMFASFYNWPPVSANLKNRASALLYRSDDDGQTWRRHAVIAPDDYNETSIHFVSDRRALAAARTFNSQTVHLYISDDGGDSWRLHAPITGAYEHNADFTALPDGRILLTYGVRHPHDLALCCRVSPDGGETWRRPHRLLQIDDTERYDGGYPSSICVGDDRIVTAYYTRRTQAHHRYHMGTVIWSWKAEFDHAFDR